jgi:ADP-ribose pyrophosphatase YjhB (NUDIX family)
MKIRKSVAVWLIDLVAKKVLLQKRSGKEDGRYQSFIGICQPAWNGKLEEGEELMDAVKREAKEELGESFASAFDFSSLKVFDEKQYSFNGKSFLGYNYWGVATKEQLSLVNLHKAAESEFVRIGSIREATKAYGITMFEDQFQTLKKLFSLKEVAETTS